MTKIELIEILKNIPDDTRIILKENNKFSAGFFEATDAKFEYIPVFGKCISISNEKFSS